MHRLPSKSPVAWTEKASLRSFVMAIRIWTVPQKNAPTWYCWPNVTTIWALLSSQPMIPPGCSDSKLITSRPSTFWRSRCDHFFLLKTYGTISSSWSSAVRVSIIVLDLSLLFDDVLFCLPFCRCPCMAINVSVQYDGGFLPDIILLNQCYYHRGTRLNAMKRFCIFSYWSHLNVLTFFPPDWGMLRRSRCIQIFL